MESFPLLSFSCGSVGQEKNQKLFRKHLPMIHMFFTHEIRSTFEKLISIVRVFVKSNLYSLGQILKYSFLSLTILLIELLFPYIEIFPLIDPPK